MFKFNYWVLCVGHDSAGGSNQRKKARSASPERKPPGTKSVISVASEVRSSADIMTLTLPMLGFGTTHNEVFLLMLAPQIFPGFVHSTGIQLWRNC